jgi:hypothetical protein
LIAIKVVTTKLGDNQHKSGSITIQNAAKMLSVGEATIKMAKAVAQNASPEIKEKVLTGELRLGMAKEIIKKPKEEQQAELERIKADRAKAAAAKAAEQATKTKGNASTKAKEAKANQAMKDVDEFCKKWKAFDNNQRRAFVVMFKAELAALLDAIQQQEAMIGAAA